VRLGMPVRMRRRRRKAREGAQRAWERRPGEGARAPNVQGEMHAARMDGAPGLWARRVGLSGPAGSARVRTMACAAEAGRRVEREVGRVRASGGQVPQIARAGGAESGVSADVRRADTVGGASIGGTRRVRFGDWREEQRRRVDAVR
jgi:hypothetical protein